MSRPPRKRGPAGRSVIRDTRYDWAGLFAWRPSWPRRGAWAMQRPRWTRREAWTFRRSPATRPSERRGDARRARASTWSAKWALPRPSLGALRSVVTLRVPRFDLAGPFTALRARGDSFRRTRAARRLAFASTGVAGIALLALGMHYGPIIAAAVADHPYFAVAEIVVTPTQKVRPGALLESVDLRPGVSLWRVDPATLAARLENHPWIRRAIVRREFPRRLVVDVVERKPAAILYLDQLYYVDTTGLAFVRVGERDPLDLPFVTGVEAAIVADERPFARHAIRQALRVLELMHDAGLPFRVSEVHIDREQGITVFPVEPRVALTFGWSGFKTKLTRLERVLRDFRGRESQIREIDLTMGTTAVVRLRQTGAKGKRTRT